MNVVADSLRSAVPSSNGTELSRTSCVAKQRVATIVNQLVTSSPAGSLVTRDYRCHTFTSKSICRDLHRLPAPDASKRTFPHEVPAPFPAAETTDARTCHEQWLDRQRRHLAGRRRHAAGLGTFLPQRPHPRPQDRTPGRRILYGCQRSFGRGPWSAVSPHVREIRRTIAAPAAVLWTCTRRAFSGVVSCRFDRRSAIRHETDSGRCAPIRFPHDAQLPE